MKNTRRNFLKYGFVSVTALFAAAAPVRFDSSEGFFAGKNKRQAVDLAQAYAKCGSSFDCSGGGGQCGASFDCSGGGGRCGASFDCSGGGGRCGASFDCSGS